MVCIELDNQDREVVHQQNNHCVSTENIPLGIGKPGKLTPTDANKAELQFEGGIPTVRS